MPAALYFWPTSLGGDTEFLIVYGKSMLPTIPSGSLVVTKTQQTYHIDDIVSFSQKEEGIKKVIVHRIIDETEQGFIIKGDNNPHKDPGFQTNENIDGKVIFAFPYVGLMLGVLRNPLVLLATSLVMIGIQTVQKHHKKKKEKLRRIRLGITKQTSKLVEQNKTQKKPDYTVFFGAIGFNVLTYILLQISVAYDSYPQGDMITGFLFRMIEYSVASTIVFSLYMVFIFGLYFLSKVYEAKIIRSKSISTRKSKSTLQLVLGKDFNPMLSVAQFLWLLFILMSAFHIMSIGTDFIDVVTCDPSKALC